MKKVANDYLTVTSRIPEKFSLETFPILCYNKKQLENGSVSGLHRFPNAHRAFGVYAF